VSAITFVDGNSRSITSFQDKARVNPEYRDMLSKVSPEQTLGGSFVHHAGSETQPQLFEVQFPPNAPVAAHAHTEDEIIVVTEGSLRFGRRVFGAGSSIFIPKMTLYSFTAGADGATFLNFRPRGGSGVVFKDEFVQARQQDASQT
jgi:quercetin dioxygenase-like cupin family protein